MKKQLTLFFLYFLSTCAVAQIEKGNFLVGANASYKQQRSAIHVNTNFSLQPSLLYFFTKRLAFGGTIQIVASQYRGYNVSKQYAVDVVPTVRFSAVQYKKAVGYLQAGLGYGSRVSYQYNQASYYYQESTNISLYDLSIANYGIGVDYFIADKLALGVLANWQEVQLFTGNQRVVYGNYNPFTAKIGLNYYF